MNQDPVRRFVIAMMLLFICACLPFPVNADSDTAATESQSTAEESGKESAATESQSTSEESGKESAATESQSTSEESGKESAAAVSQSTAEESGKESAAAVSQSTSEESGKESAAAVSQSTAEESGNDSTATASRSTHEEMGRDAGAVDSNLTVSGGRRYVYLGHTGSQKFHREKCPYGRVISPQNRVEFPFRRDAVHAGYAPCKYCLPQEWTSVRAELKNVEP